MKEILKRKRKEGRKDGRKEARKERCERGVAGMRDLESGQQPPQRGARRLLSRRSSGRAWRITEYSRGYVGHDAQLN